jgi:hypothetical protein
MSTYLITVGVVMIIISILNEIYNPFIDTNPSIKEYVHIHLIRYIHYLIFLFTSFYLVFFNGIGMPFDRYIYLFVVRMAFLVLYTVES